MLSQKEIDELNDINDMGFNGAMNLRITEASEDGYCEMVMDIGPEHLNPVGTVHGGAVFGLADTVGGFAIRAMGEFACTTCTSTIDYFSPTLNTAKLIGRAQVLKRGKRMSTVEVTIYNDKDKPVAKLLGRYANLDEAFRAK